MYSISKETSKKIADLLCVTQAESSDIPPKNNDDNSEKELTLRPVTEDEVRGNNGYYTAEGAKF